MDLAPLSRDTMRQLWTKREELRRQEEAARHRAHVTSVVREIYQRATMIASVTERRQYIYSMEGVSISFITDVLEELRVLFPGCIVSHVLRAGGDDIVVSWE